MKIGVFDSGVGGKLIAQKIQKEIPSAEVIFKSDPEYFPYGNKTAPVILERTSYFVREFEKLECSIVVIACNSATTNVIRDLRKRFPHIQFVGIEPPVKPIVELTKSGKVAVIGTEATIRSERLVELIKKYSERVKIFSVPCPGLAEHIEKFQLFKTLESGDKPDLLIRKFLDVPIAGGVDVVGIACTHYPYLLSQMKGLYPNVTFYDPADAVVFRVRSQIHL